MKKFTLISTMLFFAVSLFAQAPQAFKYQAVARNSSGNLLQNQPVAFRISILQGGPSGTLVYQESHLVTTNDYGLANVEIGKGTVLYGAFETMDWSTGQMFMMVEIDPAGGVAYVDMGTTELLSVPYALYSENSGNSPGWSLTGNSGINPDSNFLGTTDNQPLKLKVNGSQGGVINPINGNTFLGLNAGINSTGYSNVGIGVNSLHENTDRANLVAIGDSALFNNGLGAYNDIHAKDNVAVGSKALFNNTYGYNNTALGFNALYNASHGYGNTANGYKALHQNNYGSLNTALGNEACYRCWLNSNTAIGAGALWNNGSGEYNTAVGNNALYDNWNGKYCTAVGTMSSYHANGDFNTCVGFQAGCVAYTSYSTATFVGGQANPNASNYSNCMALGYTATVTASNKVVVGNSSVTSIGGYASWSNFSDGRFKSDVNINVPGLEFILKLQPVTYHLDVEKIMSVLHTPDSVRLPDAENIKRNIQQTGFIAQEVEAAAKSIGYDFSGVDAPKNESDFYGLRYAEFVVPLVKAVQEQQVMIEEFKAANDELHKKNEAMQKQIDELKTYLKK